jgi:hypothetical protein
LGDEAAISIRAHQVLSLHPPLVGLASAVSFGTGHVVFDPGPLLFYLVALPVHLDPAHGLLWGSALLGGAALSVAVEAAWSVGRWVGASVVACIALDLLWLTPAVFERLTWNAYFPVPFFVAALASAWAVAAGSTRWWPVLVLAASVAAQSHLLFLVPAAALSVLALAFGLVGTGAGHRLRWVGVGIGGGVVCWLAPLIQQATGHPGNLSALARSGGGHSTLGFAAGLRLVGLAGGPHPIWLTHHPSGFYPLAALEFSHPPWVGGLVLGVLGAIAVGALSTGRRALGSLAAVALVASAGLLVSFAVFPVKNLVSLGYLIVPLWVVGALIWVVVAWAAIATGLALSHRSARAADAPSPAGRTWLVRWGAAATALTALVVLGVIGLGPAATRTGGIDWSAGGVAVTARAASAIEREVPRGPVALSVKVSQVDPLAVTWPAEAIAFRLETDGWQPGLFGVAVSYTGLAVPPHGGWPGVRVRIRGTRLVSVTRNP